MRSHTCRACALAIALVAGSRAGALAQDVHLPPPLPTPEPLEQSLALGQLGTSESDPSDWDKYECVKCCVPCCVNCCDDPCARWTISAGALVLHRSAPNDALLFFNVPPNPSETLNANQFDFGCRMGYEIGLTRHRVCWDTDLEARLWAVDGWSDTVNASFSGPSAAVNIQPPFLFDGPRDLTSTYSSEILSLELNLRRRSRHCPRWRWIAGFRMLELDERLYTVLTSTENFRSGAWNVSTRNRLYGFHVGAEWDIISNCCWCVRGFLKGGIFGNEANNRTQFECLANPDCEPQFGDTNKSRTSFLGETGLSARYCFCPDWALRVDYRFVWVDGVALASNQFAATSQLPVADGSRLFTGADTDGNAFYHGVFVGLEWRF